MSLELFEKVLAGAIETVFDNQSQPLFKRSDLGKYLGIRNIRDNFQEFSSHHARPRSKTEGVGVTYPFGRTKNCHDIFINLDSAIEIAVRSKKPKAVALVKWLTKKGIEKIQKEHQQVITGRDNQIQALEATNEAHKQKILRLNEEIDDLIKNRHVARRGCFDNVLCFIKKNSKKAPHITLFYVNIDSLKNIKNALNFVSQKWRRPAGVMIEMLFTDEHIKERSDQKTRLLQKPF